MSDLAGLIERVGKLTEPDREVDADIALSVGYTRRNGEWWFGHCYVGKDSPAYTASLDAAVALVERVLPGAYRETTGPRRYLNIPTPVPARFRAEILHDEGSATAYHDCEPVALLIALLRALQSGGPHDR